MLSSTNMASRDPDIGFAQDLICCDLCSNPVDLHCNSCCVNLCNGCVGKHISTQASKQHDIALFVQRKSTLLLPSCEKHKDYKCDFHCLQCDIPVCPDCVTGTHKKHDLSKMIEVYKNRKIILEKETEFLENVLYPKYENAATEVKNKMTEQYTKCENVRKVIKKNGEDWHKDVDAIIKMNMDEIDRIEHDNIDQLKKNSNEIEELLSFIRKKIEDNKNTLHSNYAAGVVNFQLINDSLKSQTFKANLTSSTFIPLQAKIEQLYKEFGLLQSAIETEEFMIMKTEEKLSTASLTISPPEHLKTIDANIGKLYRICSTGPDQFWVSGPLKEIKRINDSGSTVDTYNAPISPADITVDEEDNLTATLFSSCNVIMRKSNKTITMVEFNEWNPTGMCFTSKGHLLLFLLSKVERHGKIVRCRQSTILKEIEFDEDQKPLFPNCRNGSFIVENRNRDICVSENVSSVMVFDEEGNFKWRYYGNNSLPKSNKFSPRCIVTDKLSQILVADFNNDCVHIIDANGNFLGYIDKFSLSKPCGLTLDGKDQIWIGELETGKLKCIKYMS